MNKSRWKLENAFAFSIADGFPVSEGHTLIIPKRAVISLFELNDDEFLGCWDLVRREKQALESTLQPDGFNVGVNDGEFAGQTIFHAHIHLIPRFRGDHPNPRGGVRGIFPTKADY